MGTGNFPFERIRPARLWRSVGFESAHILFVFLHFAGEVVAAPGLAGLMWRQHVNTVG